MFGAVNAAHAQSPYTPVEPARSAAVTSTHATYITSSGKAQVYVSGRLTSTGYYVYLDRFGTAVITYKDTDGLAVQISTGSVTAGAEETHYGSYCTWTASGYGYSSIYTQGNTLTPGMIFKGQWVAPTPAKDIEVSGFTSTAVEVQ